jgi:ubiquinone/menaquinone biosynthesis C-methylase UbiE
MSVTNSSDPTYAMGRSKSETERLQQQGHLFEPYTRRLLEAAGITTGMKVLDVGCGAGDVSLLAARLVGPTGSVVGVDNNPAILDIAIQRACAAGLNNVSFVAGDLRDADLDNDFDAAVGRLILLYVADQAVALRTITRHLRAGGVLAFQEADFSLTESLASNETTPPLYRQFSRWALEVFRRAGACVHMSISLSEALLRAGLPLPHMHLDGLVVHGPEWNGYDYLAECLRSVLPLLTKFGIATAEEVDVDTYAERLRAETLNQASLVVVPLLIGAWTRTAC